MNNIDSDKLLNTLERIADALEIQSGTHVPDMPDIKNSGSYVWNARSLMLEEIQNTKALDFDMLVGIDDQIETLHNNTKQFAKGFAANNALLWGSRGTGKSSLVKAVHKKLATDYSLVLIEIYREDIESIGALIHLLQNHQYKRFILFCDDLSFDEDDSYYKSLKAVLEGGIQEKPEHIIFYVTSNRRHLLSRDMMENERRTAIHGSEVVEEKISLSDRFGLWIGFYPCDQDHYFEMVENYAKTFKIPYDQKELRAKALEWSMLRGSRSGRVAWQFILDLAGRHGCSIDT